MSTQALVYIALAALAANELAARLEESGNEYPEGFIELFRCTEVCSEKGIQFPVEFKDDVAAILREIAEEYAAETDDEQKEGFAQVVKTATEAADFLQYRKTCPHCDGTGFDAHDERRPCRECDGEGVI